MEALTSFFDNVVNARFGFDVIYSGIIGLIENIKTNTNILAWWNATWEFLSIIGIWIFIALGLISLIVALFGKKMFSVLRFTAFFVAGFICGVYWLSPLVLPVIPTLPTWVIGLVGGVVSGVLSKLLYILFYAIAAGYSVYIVFCGGMIVPLTGNFVVALIAAVAAIVLAFLLRKYIEMAGTAMLGGFGAATVIRYFYDFTTWELFVGREWLGMLLFTLIIAIAGFFVQFKTRERF
ncbi:MAG: hypothetical protein IJY24_06720 [Clostridia bacterium]|nr:hypothetical protein [Clostridia bacterium]